MPVAASDPRVQRVAFAHLVGNDIDYLIKKYEITLGRKAKNYTPDVVMAETMSVSRQHAKIIYNFDTHRFELIVLGRNGVTVDGALYQPESGAVPLKSKALLQIGDVSFYFLLPKKLSKLFTTPKPAVVTHATADNVGTAPNNAVVPGGDPTLEAAAGAGAGAAPAIAAATAAPPTGAMPTQQQMIRIIQEAAARQQQQQVLAAQQQQQQQVLSPAQQMFQLQQMQQLQQGANLSPQQIQMQQMQMQLLLQQQQQFINQQQQQQQPPK